MADFLTDYRSPNGSTFKLHKDAVGQVDPFFARLNELYPQYQALGGYANRQKRTLSGQTLPGLSTHASGLTFDVRAPDHVLKQLGEEFGGKGWVWGGKFSHYDPVHFELPNAANATRALEGKSQQPLGMLAPSVPTTTPQPQGQPMAQPSYMTPEEAQSRRRMAMGMIGQNDGSPVQHWTQALGRVANSMVGNAWLDQVGRDERAGQAAGVDAMMGLMQPQPAAGTAGTSVPQARPSLDGNMDQPPPMARPAGVGGMVQPAQVVQGAPPAPVGQPMPSGMVNPNAVHALMQNPYTREFGQKMLMRGLPPTPQEQLQQRGLQLDIASKERELNTPKSNLQIIPEGASVLATDPRDPSGARVVHQGSPKLDSTSKKAIFDAQDELPALQGTIEAIKRAKEINAKVYTGAGAASRGSLMTSLPFGMGGTEEAKATTEYNQVISQQAIEAMSRTLKGATTDTEMRKFLSIIADLSQPADVRARALDRLETLATRQLQTKQERIRSLAGGTRFDQSQSPSPGATDRIEAEADLPNGGKAVKIGGQWYQK